jgi:hypothetical protein
MVPFRFISDDYALSRFAGKTRRHHGTQGHGLVRGRHLLPQALPGGVKGSPAPEFRLLLHRRPWPPWSESGTQ